MYTDTLTLTAVTFLYVYARAHTHNDTHTTTHTHTHTHTLTHTSLGIPPLTISADIMIPNGQNKILTVRKVFPYHNHHTMSIKTHAQPTISSPT
jgi:hypothetical protein